MQEMTPSSLIDAIRQGDDRAFKEIYTTYYPRLSKLASLLVEKQDAEDVIADGFLKLFMKKHDMHSLSHIEGFLHTTIRNGCLDLLRKATRRKGLLTAWLNNRKDEAGPESQADHKILFAELIYYIQSGIDSMPERSREAFRLVKIEGLSAADAGKILGVSDQTVREDVSRVLKQISAELFKKGLHLILLLGLLYLSFIFFKNN